MLLSSLMSLKLADQLRQIRPDALLSALINCNLTAILTQRFVNGFKVVTSEHAALRHYQFVPNLLLALS
jgi:hypothetical protein